MTNSDSSLTPWKSRRMKGGDWTDDAKSEDPAQRWRVVSVRMRPEELVELDAGIAPLGLSRNRALRTAARRIGGLMELDAETLALMKTIDAQLSGIARNVNQMAKAASRKDDPDYQAFMKERAHLGKELMRVQDKIRYVVDTAKRRNDAYSPLPKGGEQ
ncbi:MAG: plasmid mobilization relaxosome protein MobC [Rhodobacteraceae bacterium]|nr:MAG: plasmid mobilization relaxosome protein MobC [Paracoccaceae bacterium]